MNISLPSSDLGIAKAYFNSLPEDNVARRFYEGAKYQSPQGAVAKVYHALVVQPKQFEELSRFYPYQRTLEATKKEWEGSSEDVLKNSLILSGLAFFTIFNLGRRNYVLPLLREYGRYAGTHRIFRQYAYAGVLPFLLLKINQYRTYYNHFEALNHIHANRLNQKILSDPENSHFPKEIAPKRSFDE